MSRYVHVTLGALTLDEVAAALKRLDIPHARGELMLEGSLECVGEPVAIRIEPAPVGAVEDLGFIVEGGELRLVCGELDRALLERDVLPRVRAEVTATRVRTAAQKAGLQIEEVARSGSTERVLRVRAKR